MSNSTRHNAPPADPGVSATPNAPPLKRRRECLKAREAFKFYCELRMERSLKKVAEKFKTHISQIGRWSSKYHWVERADADDAGLEREYQEAAERVAKQDIEKWARRKRDRLEEKFQLSEQWLETAKLINKLPLMDQKTRRRNVRKTGARK